MEGESATRRGSERLESESGRFNLGEKQQVEAKGRGKGCSPNSISKKHHDVDVLLGTESFVTSERERSSVLEPNAGRREC